MKICVIGTGYVGLVAGTCLAEMGNDVICVDKDKEKLKKLKKGMVPIFEPGLEELILSNVEEKRLVFSNDLSSAVKQSLICFIAVGTPQDDDGSADLTAFFEVVEQIAKSMNEYKVIVDKSTVPVGTAEKVEKLIAKNTVYDFDVVSNPEFLKQGAAVDDFLRPDRVIIGSNSKHSTQIMQELYSPFVRTGNPVLVMDVKSAEMTKYASNAFLAAKISFINEMANICEKVGADIEMVRQGMYTDRRIGSQFLYPGIGYGGSCFPKDVKALIKTAEDFDCANDILKAADKTNQRQRELFIQKILQKYNHNLQGRVFGVWGLSFKPKTNDMREAPSITIINELLSLGAKIQAFDPKAIDCAKEIFGSRIKYAQSSYEALSGADALLLLTEWNEFKHPDFDKIKKLLKKPLIFDGRNQYDKEKLDGLGFEYYSTGRK